MVLDGEDCWEQSDVMEQEGGGGIVRFNNAKLRKTIGKSGIIPDSSLLDENDLKELLPDSLRYLVCEGKIETGSPCAENKWNTSAYCHNHKYQVSWHPGW